jgi:hypothetical protein
MTRLLFLLVIAGLSQTTRAQVSNNNIQNLLSLELNADPFFSSTAQSTVEWKCINRALTSKCLVYHNDQWFNFSVPVAGAYFINISEQKCRDLRGIQLIIIEGNPCETTTYRILHCIPQIRQDDVFVQLDSLKPKIKYLINIDGFLGDFCEFGIQVSDKPGGLPRIFKALDTLTTNISRNGKLIHLTWTVSEDKINQFQSFKIYRTVPNGVKSNFITEQAVSRNSYGAYVLSYSAADSLQDKGVYSYQIVGIQKQTEFPSLLVTRSVEYSESLPKVPPQRSVTLQLDFKERTPFNVLVYDNSADALLKKFTTEFKETKNRSLEIDLGEFIDKGLKQFFILVSDGDARQALEFYYAVDGQGRLVMQ